MLAAAGLYVLSAAALHATEGLFNATWLPVYFAGFAVWIALAARGRDAPRSAPASTEAALLALCAFAAWFWHAHALLADARMGPALKHFREVPWAIAGLCGLAFALKRAWWPLAAAVALTLYAKTVILETSPVPFIDVFTSNTRAADHFLAGRNPYTQVYPDIYGGGQDYRPGMVYWPAVLLWQSAARAWFGDIRWGFVAAEVITAGALSAALTRLGLTPRRALLVVLAWALSPVAPFVFEQAWIDPLLTMAFALFACAMAYEQAILAGCALGLAVAFKQYGAFGALAGLALAARVFDRRRLAQLLVAAGATFAVTTLPIALRALDPFLEMTLRVPSRMGLRRDALSLLVFAADGLTPSLATAVTLVFGVGATVAGAVWLYRLPRPTVAHWSAATGLAYGGLFFFGKQAFCNYHHFLATFVLLHGAALLAAAPQVEPEAEPEPRAEAEPGRRRRRRR